MDTATHGIAGAVLTRAVAQRPGARAALILGAAAAMAPDLDFLFLSDRLDYLRNHRSWSHSFVYLPFFALALALLGRLVFRRARLTTLWVFSGVGIASHIFFDWITSFGTMFWVPISRTRHSLDWVFLLDPIFTGIVLAGLLASLVFRVRGRRIAVMSSAVLAAYVALCASLHARALEIWRKLEDDRAGRGRSVAVLPQFLSPFRWLGLSDGSDEIHACFFDIGPFARGVDRPEAPMRYSEIFRSLSDFYPPPSRAVVQKFHKPPESLALSAALRLPDVQTYLTFARFPLATVTAEENGVTAITWEDLRFLPWFSGPWTTEQGGRMRREPFVYRVRLDAAGRPIERAFVPSSRFR